MARLSRIDVSTQSEALRTLAQLTLRGTVDPLVRATALAITQECPGKDSECEIESIFNAVKYGDSRIPALSKGVRYVADPQWADHFTAPARLLKMCASGLCAEDCDGQAALIAALAGSIGFTVGLRAWGPPNTNEYQHVYAVAIVPKGSQHGKIVGLDSTVEESSVGWEPPSGRILTAWIDGRFS